MARNYDRLRRWSDTVMPLVTDVFTRLGIPTTVAPAEEDIHHCADLLDAGGRRIAVRVREHTNERYRDRLTIRCRVVSGRRTELDKLIEDPPAFYLLGVADHDGTSLAHWRLVDGTKLAEVLRAGDLERHENDDGTAFVEVDLVRHPDIVIRRHDDEGLIERQQKKYMATRIKQVGRPT